MKKYLESINRIYNLQDIKVLPWDHVNEPTITDRNPAWLFFRIPKAQHVYHCSYLIARVGTFSKSSLGHKHFLSVSSYNWKFLRYTPYACRLFSVFLKFHGHKHGMGDGRCNNEVCKERRQWTHSKQKLFHFLPYGIIDCLWRQKSDFVSCQCL